jgi:TonB family protein
MINANLIGSLRQAYNLQLRRKFPFEGRVLIRFTIMPTGQVVNPAIVQTSTQRPDFDDMVRSRVCDLKFDPVKTLGEISIVYPFEFKAE